MKKITLLCAIFLLTINIAFSQNIISKRIQINNPSRTQLLNIKDVGIDLSCGALFSNNNLILEIGESDLNALDRKGVIYTVLVDNLIEHYKLKNETELPIAIAELKAEKSQKLASRSLSTKDKTINNFIQYEGCDEVDWDVPNNFKLGSMGGCLTYSEVLAELDEMRDKYPNLISVKTDASPGTLTNGNQYTNGGQYDTWAGQPIYFVRISDNPNSDETDEPESLFSGMTHSREVSSMMNLMYYMWYILENYNKDAGIKSLVDNHEMYFIPVANPDGLMWNEQIAPNGGGLQRKNLGNFNTGNNQQRGVDLNRNYDYFWGDNPIYGGSSGATNSDVYRGPSAFSEPETQIVRNFSATRQFKTALNHHASSNLLPHAYNGYPSAPASGREAEYHKFCHDLTRYNRYIYGEAPDVLTVANGDMSDWMLGGVADVNGSTGSGQGILALAPENGSWVTADGEGGFWPNPSKIVEIAQRAVRMNFVNAYHSGKFAQFHDFNTTDVITTSGNFEFGLEYLGQTLGDITLNVTPVSGIQSITSPSTQTGWSKLEQRRVTATYTLNPGIQPGDLIEFEVELSNNDGYVMYRANIVKYYTPSVIHSDNPDATGMNDWTASGASWGTITTTDYTGSSTMAITDSPGGAYGNNINGATLTYDNSINLASSTGAVIQYYAKWDLERNFDYVQIQGSTNGSTWVDLCGKYTKPASSLSTNRYSSASSSNTSTGKNSADQNNQPTGELIYDGDSMDKWVMEEIYINAGNNSALLGSSNVQFRFLFDSDNTNRADGYPTTFDGFIFDDFKIISLDDNIAQSIDFDPILDKSIVSNDFTINAVASSGLPVTFVILSGPATISGNTISLNGTTGTVMVQASQSGNSEYNAANNVTNSFEVTEQQCRGVVISSFPYVENFDGGIGDWEQGKNDIPDLNYEDWTLNSGNTVSGDTGPTRDFTAQNTGNSTIGNYFYTEASNANNTTNVGQNVTVTLLSPCIDLNGYENGNFSFYYHMTDTNTNEIGNLSVEISTDSGETWSQINASGNLVTNNPILQGQQQPNEASNWIKQDIDLSNYSNQIIKLRFSGITGTTFRSDIAIDEINLTADVVSAFTPVASCQNINAILDGSGNITISSSDINSGSSSGNLSIDISSFTCGNIGTNNVTLTATDPSDSGNTDTCVAVVTVIDTTAPVADLATLEDVIAECQVTTLTASSATDNCSGSVTVTNDATLPISTQATTVVTWTYDDGNGNTSTQTQNIVIDDTTAPVANLATLADVIAECQVTSLTAPSATDNCSGSVTVTNDATLPISTQGTTVITWTYDDGNGNTSTQTQNIVIDDTTAPVADLATLADVTAECQVTTLTAPSATDNCSGSVTVTNDATLPISTQGTTVVTWTYDDGNGNTSTQTQNIVIDDTTAPVADLATLADVTAECQVTTLTAPSATDNCSGSVTVTNDATLPISTQGTTVITWTYDDGNGNTSTQTQNIVIDDTTAPVADLATLADVTAECQVTTLTAPSATDNCSGSVTVTNDATLPISTQATTVITWTYDDGNGNTSTQTQNVVIDDTTAPIANLATLADVTAECQVTTLTAPSATDNCSGSVTVTNNATLPISTQGTTVVTWTYDDGNGNTSTQTQNIIIDDNTVPVADLATLADVIAECQVTTLTAPSATDNCSGSVTVTNNATLPISTQGTTVVTWTYDDGNGNTSTQTQNIIIDDNTAPVADLATLADVTAECQVITLTAPSATDNCSGSVTVTNNATLPISTQGTTVVTWTYDDGNGNTSTQTQNIIIDDNTAPVADLATLADVTAECQVITLTAPSATDNCSGSVTVTNNATLPISTQGTTVVTWTYDDGNGNTSTQTQNIIIDDNTAPVADLATLADVTAECQVTTLTDPSATDNCSGSVTVTNNATLPISSQGTTVVTWTYDDGNGNTSAQTQNIVIDDTTAPIANLATLADVTAECQVTTLTAPSATDNCSGSVTVTNDATLPISSQATTVVTWTYDDGNGNTSTQTQNVVIDDNTAPIANLVTLADVTAECQVTTLTAPSATDNCSGLVTVTNDATLPISTQATTVVTWTYDDGNGNTSTQTQNIVIDDNTAPVAFCKNITVTLDGSGNATIVADDIDNGSSDSCGSITLTASQTSFNSSDIGDVNVTLTVEDNGGNSITCNAVVTVQADTLKNTEFNLESVLISPNPFNDTIIIKTPLGFNNRAFNIKIFDLNGRLVIDRTQSSFNDELKVTGLDKLDQAPYLFKLVDTKTGETSFKRLIKD